MCVVDFVSSVLGIQSDDGSIYINQIMFRIWSCMGAVSKTNIKL